MKKIAIITITNNGMNFGNRLQNYALQRALEDCNAQVQTIDSSKNLYNSIYLSRIRRILKIILTSRRRKQIFMGFDLFDKKYIKKANNIRYVRINEHIFNKQFDAFITGSDQVWNPHFEFNSEFEFLTFADSEKRFSYAASFGINEIPEDRKQEYADWLKGMRQISVREKQGCEIVKELSGREAFLHIDPTMLLNAEQYAEIEEKPPHPLPEKYLLTYFLGSKKPEYITFIEETSKKLNLAIFELGRPYSSQFLNIGPQHFLYLLKHAEYICTDSFHGVVFSLLFHKPFTAFYRDEGNISMNSRIDTILEKLNLKNRIYGTPASERTQDIINYSEVENYIRIEREAAFEYLREIVDE